MLNRLANFPVAFFSMTMGLSGLSLAWHQADELMEVDYGIWEWLSWFVLVIFVLTLLTYVIKIFKYPAKVLAEFKNSQQVSFFSAITVSLILVAGCMLDLLPQLAKVLWLIGTLGHLILTVTIINRWIYNMDNNLSSITPVWFIPTVGNILVPIVGIKFAPTEFVWFFFSLGLLLWLIILIMLFFRLFFDEPLPTPMIPTMFIMLAPPAVAFIAWMSFNLELDFFARFLYYSAMFIFLILFSKIFSFLSLPFSIAWWSYSFPLAAMAIASFKMYSLTQMSFLLVFAWGLLIFLSVLVIYLLVRTAVAIKRHELIPMPKP